MTATVRVDGLRGGYAPGDGALESVTFTAAAGQTVAVLGPNGGGKTTLFRALLAELPVREGLVELDGTPAYVAQTERARLDFPVSAHEVVLMGAYARTPWWRRIGAADRAAAGAALARVGLADRAKVRFGELSGGQRQRVAIARALVQDARVMLLDEPLSGVDRVSGAQIDLLFDALRDEGRTLLVATHDVEAARRCDRVLCLARRQVAFGPPEETLRADVLRETYGAELVLIDGDRTAVTIEHGHGHDHG